MVTEARKKGKFAEQGPVNVQAESPWHCDCGIGRVGSRGQDTGTQEATTCSARRKLQSGELGVKSAEGVPTVPHARVCKDLSVSSPVSPHPSQGLGVLEAFCSTYRGITWCSECINSLPKSQPAAWC